jgi:hypothetical protein
MLVFIVSIFAEPYSVVVTTQFIPRYLTNNFFLIEEDWMGVV